MPPPTVCPIPRVVSSSKCKPGPLFKYDTVSKRNVSCFSQSIDYSSLGDFTLTSWEFVGSDPLELRAIWTPSSNATSYTLLFLVSDTYPVTSSSTVLASYSTVNSGDLLSVPFQYSDINCKFFGVQVIAMSECATKYSNIISDQYLIIQPPIPPATATLTFGVSDLTINFPNGINVFEYEVYLYDVTIGDYALINPILSGVTTNLSPWVISYLSLIPFQARDPPLITGNQYKLIIAVVSSPGGCFAEQDYHPVVFNQTFPSPP
jgi:hypothetical protein